MAATDEIVRIAVLGQDRFGVHEFLIGITRTKRSSTVRYFVDGAEVKREDFLAIKGCTYDTRD